MTKMSSRKKKKEYEAEETIKEIILSTMNGKRFTFRQMPVKF